MFLSFHKYVNNYKRHKIVPKKKSGALTFIMELVLKLAILSVFLF